MQCENDINLPNVYEAKNNPSKVIPYVPGDFTEEHHRPESYDELASKRFEDKSNTGLHLIGKGYPRYREDFSRVSPTLEKVFEKSEEGKDMPKTAYRPPEERLAEMNEDDGAIRDTMSNFLLAKELHRQNLDHNPLPDKICHTQFQRMQMMRDQEPGLALEEGDYATGVGWKGYQGYGPTRCTKLKVFRPKSSLLQPRRPGEKADTWANFEQKWRFIKQSKVSPMDLALCWDLRPEDPKDEPKRPVHIDGSNGCSAPAVFSMVHTPKENIEKKGAEHSCDGVRDCVPLFYSTSKFGDDTNYFFERRSARDFSEQLQQRIDDAKRSNSAYELRDIDKIKEEDNTNNKNSKRNGSIPKLYNDDTNQVKCDEKHPCCSHYRKKTMFAPKRKYEGSCVTCQMNNISIGDAARTKEKKNVKYTSQAGLPLKRKEKRDEYPEHWRLATVYQHSYKPIKNRKCTLLSTVFK
ncbi:uncharacterized protein LOC123676792 isoform X2 [Harmonia axyridis]|uniref:uncharacterized protein LOC123676792 isoform X2 n=1 Tax=Harmonia axyridis TaxID=115357 RepID=UPI001E2775A8|nr:uncharacterized protein LOC123676792 isoform X2 [Harmonia axyridis]